MARIAADFEWNRVLSRKQIAHLLGLCQEEINLAWESTSMRVKLPAKYANVPREFPIQKWAIKLDPDRPMFPEERDYFAVELGLLYSPLTDIPVFVEASRDRGKFYLSFVLETGDVLDESIPIDLDGNFCTCHHVDLDEIDLTDYFYSAWLTNGEILRRIAHTIESQTNPTFLSVSPEIKTPSEKASLHSQSIRELVQSD